MNQATLPEARVLHHFHLERFGAAADPDTRALHDRRADYWHAVIVRLSNMVSSPEPADLHSYTHTPDGTLTRLDIPSDDEG